MRTLAVIMLAASLASIPASLATAEKLKLSEADKAEILTLATRVETAVAAKDAKLLQACCDPWGGLWIDAGHSGCYNPAPVIY